MKRIILHFVGGRIGGRFGRTVNSDSALFPRDRVEQLAAMKVGEGVLFSIHSDQIDEVHELVRRDDAEEIHVYFEFKFTGKFVPLNAMPSGA